jgi:hypothetical protein
MARKKDPEEAPEELPASPEEEPTEAELGYPASTEAPGAAAEGSADLPADEAGGGMMAVEPIFEEGGLPPAPESELTDAGELGLGSEGGMGAVEPILREEDFPPEPGLPVAEMALPDPKTSMRGAPLFSAAAFLAPGPIESLAGAEAPVLTEERIAKEEMIALLITEEKLTALWERADKVAVNIIDNIDTLQIGRTMLDQVKFFRNEILSGKDRFEDAERHLNEVEYQVAANQRVKKWSSGLGIGLFLYELLWGAVALAVLFFLLGPRAFSDNETDLVYLVGSMMWGGLGGVIGAWYSLVQHIARDQDFDRQHRMWYFNSPLMGMGVGAVVYAILRAGLLSLTGPGQSIASPFFIYVLAWLAGYQHNVFTDIIKRILKVFKIEDEPRVEGAVSLDIHQPEEETKVSGQITESKQNGTGG